MNGTSRVTLVEVGPRDGFQPIGPVVPTPVKIDLIRRLHAAGLRRIEATAFVSDTAIPQLADAREVLDATRVLPGLDVQVLVPNRRHADRALAAGADHLAFVVSVSEKHNRKNIRRSPAESVAEFNATVAALPPGVRIRLNIATAFDCPFDGAVPGPETIALLDTLLTERADVEVALCDTTGRVTPDRVEASFDLVMARYPAPTRWVFHGHDTYGLGVANVLAAYRTGVRVFDASFGGLGGCPFAPGATGNVATEDVVWTLEQMGIATGVDLDLLLGAANLAVALPGAAIGGRVRTAMSAVNGVGRVLAA